MVEIHRLQAKRRSIAFPEGGQERHPPTKVGSLAEKILKKSLSFKLLLQRARSVDF
jgi:hypothetical protein